MTFHYLDPDGKPITVERWAELFDDTEGRTFWMDDVAGGRTVRTVYLGFVDQSIPGARLFGTGLLRDGNFVMELELYDSKADAERGHTRHVEALRGKKPDAEG